MNKKIKIFGDIFWLTKKNDTTIDLLCSSQVSNVLLNANQHSFLKKAIQKLRDAGKKIFLFINEHTLDVAVDLDVDGVFVAVVSGKDLEKIDVFLTVAEVSLGKIQGITKIIAVFEESKALLNAASFPEKSQRFCALAFMPNTKLHSNQTNLEIILLIAKSSHVSAFLMTPDIHGTDSCYNQKYLYGFDGVIAPQSPLLAIPKKKST
ncbi:hypothetical protein B488_04570 [Liberibacter crescens BT-1]|uniref:Uncharacterized protein n=1 Tax=Liberibacter crescens (strain BT-1) TaxID=1215343 RepID=L0ESG5_LIBCB|nr:hypothetical protein [Liberibacter crescens]AGA64449.1 hypothetical protein B488_04570 [Liberibacter crescens BT-1]AMC12625.1 hypothetical protein RL73_02405 [Liberibacter crescens]